MSFFTLKTLHILSMVLLFGTGLGSAFYKWMASLAGWPLTTPWIAISLALYLVAGACWLPVVWLQIRMHHMASDAFAGNVPLPASYWRMARAWFWLGVPAFISMVLVVALMVFKHIPGVES